MLALALSAACLLSFAAADVNRTTMLCLFPGLCTVVADSVYLKRSHIQMLGR